MLICETGWLFPSVLQFENQIRNSDCRGNSCCFLLFFFTKSAEALTTEKCSFLLLPCQPAILPDWTLSHRETACEAERLYHNTEGRRFSKQMLCFFPTVLEACFTVLLFIQYLLSPRELAKVTVSHIQHCMYHTFTVLFRG